MRDRIACWFRFLARLSLGQAIIFLPFRFRFSLIERPAPPLYRDFTDILLFTSDFFILSTLVFWMANLILAFRRVQMGPSLLSIPIAALTGIAALSTVSSIQPQLSLYHALRLILLAGVYLYMLNERDPLVFILPAVGIQLLIQSLAGIAQYRVQRSLGLQSLGEIDLDPLDSGVSVVWVEGTRLLRAYGLTDHPNILGGCLAFSLILLLLAGLKGGLRRNLVLPGLFALGLPCLLFTFSRSAWLALAAGGVFAAVLLLKTQKAKFRLKTFRLVCAGLVLMSPFLWWNAKAIGVRLNWQGSFHQVAQEKQSLGERRLLNTAAVQIFQEHLWTGTGLSTFPYALRDHAPELPVSYSPAHNIFFDTAAELGIFGALSYTAISISPWLALWFKRKQLVFTPDLIVASALLLAITTASFFDYYTWFHLSGRLWQWLGWGLWGMTFQQSLSPGRING